MFTLLDIRVSERSTNNNNNNIISRFPFNTSVDMKKHENDWYLDLNQACGAERVLQWEGVNFKDIRLGYPMHHRLRYVSCFPAYQGERRGLPVFVFSLVKSKQHIWGCNPVISSRFLTIWEVRDDGVMTFMAMLQISTRAQGSYLENKNKNISLYRICTKTCNLTCPKLI